MGYKWKYILLFVLWFGTFTSVKSQVDSTDQLKFDFGLVRDKNRHMWPLLYKHKTKDYKDLQLFFTIYRSYKSYTTPYKHNHFLPFYWYDSSAALKDIRIGTLYYPSLFRIISDTTSKSKSYRFLELAPEINFLNITKSKTGLLTQNNFFFFIWSKNDVLNHKSNFVAFPIYWYYRNEYRTTNTLFPIYRYVKINDLNEKNFSFYPGLYFYKKENRTVRHSALLLFYSKKYEQNDSVHLAHKTVLFPLLFTHTNKDFTNFTLFPLVHYDKTFDWLNPKTNLVVTPLFWHKRTTEFNRNIFFPIYWQKNEYWKHDSSKRTFVFPVYYTYKSNAYKSKAFIPVVWYKRSIVDTSLTVFPLYWQSHGANQSNHLLFPFWYKYKQVTRYDTIYKQYFIPFVFYKTWNKEKSLTVFPFYSKKASVYGSSSKYIFPVYYAEKDNNHSFKSLLPLYFYNKNRQAKFHLLLPVWYHKKRYSEDDTIKTNLILPVYYSYKSKWENTRLIVPILYKNEYRYKSRKVDWHEKTFALFPFYFKNESNNNSKTIGITPLYWAHDSYDKDLKINRTYKTLFPVWWYKNILVDSLPYLKSNTIFPVWFSKTNKQYQHKVLFPIVWKYQDTGYKNITVFPFYHNYALSNKSYQLSAYTPFVWRVKGDSLSKYFIFPFVWSDKHVRKNDTIDNTVIFPFYWHYKNSVHNNTTLFPFYWKYKDQQHKSVTVIPFVHFEQTGYDSNAVKQLSVYPLLYTTRSKSLNQTTFLPLYFSKQTKDEKNTVVFPLWWSTKDSFHQSSLLIPFYYRNKEYKGLTTTAVTPLFWNLKAPGYSRNVLFPVWFSGTDSNSTYRCLFPLYYREKLANKTTITAITPLFWKTKSPEMKSHVLFPIWWSKTDSFQKSRTLFPLFHYQSSRDNAHKLIGITPLYWYYKDGSYTSKTLFPLWFNKKDTGKYAYQSNFIFPLVYTYQSENKSTLHVYPLVFANKTPAKKSFLFIPLYFHDIRFSKTSTERRTMLTPLVWINRDSNDVIFNRFRILPLFWHKSLQGKYYSKTSNTLFPIYFDVKKQSSNDSAITNITRKHVLFPIVWSFVSNNSKSLTLFPVYHFNKDTLSQNLAITPLFWSIKNVKKEQHFLWPLYNYNRLKDNSNTRFNIAYFLYRYQKTDKVKSWSFLWPLVQRIKGNNYSYFHAAPFVWYKKSDSMNYFSVQPLFFSQRTNVSKRFQLLWQLYSYRHTFNVKTTNSFLWRTFYKDQYVNGDYETRLLYKLYADVKKDSSTERGLFPLYNIQQSKNGDYYKAYCLNIYQKTKTQIPNTSDYYIEEKIFWYIRLRSNFNYLKQKGVIKDRKFK